MVVSKKKHLVDHAMHALLNKPLSETYREVPQFMKRLEWILKHVEGDVLDVGCNDGPFTIEIAKKGHDVVGVEILADLVLKAWDIVEKNASEEWASRIAFEVADAENLPYDDAQFDTVAMTETLEHVRNPRVALREAHRVLVKNGKLLLTVPNFNIPQETHYHQFDMAKLLKLLDGLFIIEQTDFDMGSIYVIGRKIQVGRPMIDQKERERIVVPHSGEMTAILRGKAGRK
jgi:SAM-dependent methyltransferase